MDECISQKKNQESRTQKNDQIKKSRIKNIKKNKVIFKIPSFFSLGKFGTFPLAGRIFVYII